MRRGTTPTLTFTLPFTNEGIEEIYILLFPKKVKLC